MQYNVTQMPRNVATLLLLKACALAQVLQDLVRGIRNSRAEYGVDLGMRIPATLVIEDDALR